MIHQTKTRLTLAVLVGFLLTGSAKAATPVIAESTFRASDSSLGFGSEQARCDRGSRATGGGVALKGSALGVRLNASAPLAKEDTDVPNRFYAAASAEDATFKALAICKRGSDARLVTSTFIMHPQSTSYGFAACAPGERVIGGGVAAADRSTFAASFLTVHASGPLAIGATTETTGNGDKAELWYAAVYGSYSGPGGGDLPKPVDVYAVCSAESKATIRAAETTLAAGSERRVAVRCAKGKDALAGGIVQTGAPAGIFTQWSAPRASSIEPAQLRDGDVPNGWAGMIQNTTGADRSVEAYAICA
jgi:hypothetical protein